MSTQTDTPKILGLSASIRSSRAHPETHPLVGGLAGLADSKALTAFLRQCIRADPGPFVEAHPDLSFDEAYRKYRHASGHRSLSNSEAGLYAALWAAQQAGCDIHHVPLSRHFPTEDETRDLDALLNELRRADAVVLASPVYFGDRGSLADRFLRTVAQRVPIDTQLQDKLFAGIAVGAKRNGGQETTLVFQLMDALELDWLVVGNDTGTTAQYGGTLCAGDLGMAAEDEYGLKTAIGVGKRLTDACRIHRAGKRATLRAPAVTGVWQFQEKQGQVRALLDSVLPKDGPARFQIPDLFDGPIHPCIACDLCPTRTGPDEEYRCIIHNRDDVFVRKHRELIEPDILMPVMYAGSDRRDVQDRYQLFMERTRYLRRDAYMYANRMVVPLAFVDLKIRSAPWLRPLVSFIRHNTILHRPILAWMQDDQLLDADSVRNQIAQALRQGNRITAGRLATTGQRAQAGQYHPIGYPLATRRQREDRQRQADHNKLEQRRENEFKRAATAL